MDKLMRELIVAMNDISEAIRDNTEVLNEGVKNIRYKLNGIFSVIKEVNNE